MTGVRDFFVRVSVLLAIVIPLWFAFAAIGTKIGLLDWRFGFGMMTLTWGPLLLLAGGLIGVIAILLSLIVSPRRARIAAFVSFLPAAAGLAFAGYTMENIKGVPPIHDVSTNLIDPPGFSEAVVSERARVPGGNPLDFAGARVPASPRFAGAAGKLAIDLHRESYADIKPLESDIAPADLFEIALDSARAQGWTIGRSDPATGRIEARQESRWFGFVDDVAIRIRPMPDGTGSVVDVRSSSRVGVSDLGANAKRVRAYLTDLENKLATAATAG